LILVFDEKSSLISGLQYDLIRCFDNLVVAYFFGPRVYTYYFERYANYRLITLAKVLVHYTRPTSNKYRVGQKLYRYGVILNDVFPNGNRRNIYILPHEYRSHHQTFLGIYLISFLQTSMKVFLWNRQYYYRRRRV